MNRDKCIISIFKVFVDKTKKMVFSGKKNIIKISFYPYFCALLSFFPYVYIYELFILLANTIVLFLYIT